MVDFMEDTLRIVHWFIDPKNQNEVTEIASKRDQGSRRSVSAGCSPRQDYYRNPDMLPNLEALQSNINTTRSWASSRRASTSRNTPISASSRKRPSA